jgi:hypothetical protein
VTVSNRLTGASETLIGDSMKKGQPTTEVVISCPMSTDDKEILKNVEP